MEQLDSASAKKRDAWARRAGTETYIQEMGEYALARDEAIIRALLRSGPGRILDLPCGTGRFLELEKELGYQITAADYSPTMLSVAQQHVDVEFVQADAFNPPFAPNSFDVILISRLMFHYDHPERILRALLPCLKTGGRIVFDTLNVGSLRWWLSQCLRPFRRDAAQRLYFERPNAFIRTLNELGLNVVETRSAYFYPTRMYRSLPKVFIKLGDVLEAITPPSWRVLTYWNVQKQ